MSTATLQIEKKKALVPQLRFQEFEGEWKKCLLDDVTKYVKGFAFKSEDYQENGVRIVRVSDLSTDRIKNENEKVYIDESKSKLYDKYKLNSGNIIITTVGSKPEMIESAVGRGIYIHNDNEGLLNQNMLKFENIKNVDNGYIIGLINSKRYQHYMKSIARGNANQSNITVVDLLQYQITIPTLSEQKKIASFLSAVDDKIQQLTRKANLLEHYKKGVMQQLFSGKLRFKDENGKDYPEWEEKKLGDVLEQQIREVDKPKENYLAIGIRSHVKGTFQKPDSDPSKIAMDKLFVVKENDLVVNITFAWEGAIAIVKKEDDGGLVSHRFPTYTFKSNLLLREYFAQVIIDKKFRMILDLISPGGAGRNRVLSKKEFLKINWSLPCIQEQQKIANFLSGIDSKIEMVNEQLAQTQTFKKGLLQQMFV